jgi:class 3 adenylate cyclase
MKVTTNKPYDFTASFDRLQDILDSTETFEQVDTVPNSDTLSYSNGYYFKCYAIFIDIRDSSTLPGKYQKRTLAKIYRAYISEIVALFQSSSNCKEINIVGDSVWAIYNAKIKDDVSEVFHAAFAACSIINTLNYKLCKKGIDPIRVGIGIDKGDALMILAGFKGSGINDVIYMGGVVNNASKLCSKGSKNSNGTMVISNDVYNDLQGKGNGTHEYQSYFTRNYLENNYHASMVRIDMNNWLIEQQTKSPCNR